MPESGGRFRFRQRPLTWAFFAAAVVLIAYCVVCLVDGCPKHTPPFIGLAILALVGVWFSTGYARIRRGTER
jgi:hypothetical protein